MGPRDEYTMHHARCWYRDRGWWCRLEQKKGCIHSVCVSGLMNCCQIWLTNWTYHEMCCRLCEVWNFDLRISANCSEVYFRASTSLSRGGKTRMPVESIERMLLLLFFLLLSLLSLFIWLPAPKAKHIGFGRGADSKSFTVLLCQVSIKSFCSDILQLAVYCLIFLLFPGPPKTKKKPRRKSLHKTAGKEQLGMASTN